MGPLNRDRLMRTAADRAGLSDYGDLYFVPALDALVAAMEGEARLNDVGRSVQTEKLVNILVNRLRAEDHFRRHPEILESDLRVDAVIVGLPRTGSTFLHRLLASDARNTAMRYWEGQNPAPFPDERRGLPSDRIAAAERTIAAMFGDEFDAIHAMGALNYEEEILLQEHTFHSAVPEAAMYVPSYARFLMEVDHRRAYRDLVRWLKFLSWQDPGRAGKHWILKGPQHVQYVDVLLEVFPGCKIVNTHRDPVRSVPSMCSMAVSYSTTFTDAPDRRAIGRHWYGRLRWMLEQFVERRARLPEEAFVDVDYDAVVSDPMATVERIYEQLDRPLTRAARADMKRWMADNPAGRHGTHHYDAQAFGFGEDDVRRDFAFYRERHVG